MTREKALLNMQACMIQLATYQKISFITCDISQYGCRIHYFNGHQTKEEVEKAASTLDTIRYAESNLEFSENPRCNVLTFDVYWDIDY